MPRDIITIRRRGGYFTAPPVGGGNNIAWVNAADGGNVTGTSFTWSYTVGSGSNRLLVVAVIGDTATDDVTGVTYNSVAMTLATKTNPGGHASNRWTYLFYLLGPSSGSNSIVISCTSSHLLVSGAADYSGVRSSAQPDATTTNVGSGSISTLTTNLTTVANNAWAILIENSFQSNNPPTANIGLTRRTFDATFGSWGIFDSAGPITPPQSYAMATDRALAIDTIIHAVASFASA